MSEAEQRQAALEANAAFYRALSEGDYDAMDELWAHTEPVLCLHPGTPALHGRGPVMQSWRELLARAVAVRPSSARVEMIRGLAFVSCLEHLAEGTFSACNSFVWEEAARKRRCHQAGILHPLDPEASNPGERLP